LLPTGRATTFGGIGRDYVILFAWQAKASRVIMNKRRRILLSILVLSTVFLALLKQQDSLAAVAKFGQSLNISTKFALTQKRKPRVGIQIGHYKSIEQPDELKNIRYSTGAQVGRIKEVDINLAVAKMLRDMLEARGILVDILPATVPQNYRADVFISIHADASKDKKRRGYKSAYFNPSRNIYDHLLKEKVDESYFYFMGLPDDDENVSGAMLEYYAFNKRRFKHSISPKTAGLIVEIGYISNPEDLQLIKDPVNPAYALKVGIIRYLKARGLLD